MAEETYTRPFPAPRPEWLTRKELAAELELDLRFINQLIREGRFPRGTPWNGKELRWPWWVVVWFRLQKSIEPLLSAGDGPEDDEDDGGTGQSKPPKR